MKPYDMATTLEALIAAVDMDGASHHQVRKVCIRFGIEHKRLGPAERSWIWEMVRSELRLPDRFFIGHHLRLQEGVFETQLNRAPARKKQEIWPWRCARRLWRLTRQLWQPRKEDQTKPDSKKRLRKLASRSAPQPPGKVVPLAKRSRSAATTTITNPPVDESISMNEFLVEGSVGHQEEDKKSAAPGKMTDTESLAERHGVAESPTTEAPAHSRPAGRQTRSLLEESTSGDDPEPAETRSQDSNTTFNDEKAPTSSSVATIGTEKPVEHSAESATEDDSKAHLETKAEEMWEMVKMLDSAIRKIAEPGNKMTAKDKKEIRALRKQRQRIVDRRSLVINKLRRR